jgi:hypothetical protein
VFLEPTRSSGLYPPGDNLSRIDPSHVSEAFLVFANVARCSIGEPLTVECQKGETRRLTSSSEVLSTLVIAIVVEYGRSAKDKSTEVLLRRERKWEED